MLDAFSNYNDDDTLRVNSFQESASLYVAYAGPFRFTANSINSSRNVQLSGLSRGGRGARSHESDRGSGSTIQS